MILSDLKIHHLRTITSAHLSLHSKFNFITGPNGSGKTSILEALYLLSCGHSFRSREISPIISHGEKQLTVFARSQSQETISIQKSSFEATQIKLNNHLCTSTSQIAYALPCQIIYADIFSIIDAGPAVRRSVLDWGLFHVKPSYLSLWKEYKKVLKQRNALLKNHVPYSQFIPWDKLLSELASDLDLLRRSYFSEWKEAFYAVLQKLTQSTCTIEYYKGWDKKKSGKQLMDVLAEQFAQDKSKQYTQYGAHQSDIIIESNDHKVKNTLSRGQQKIILIALKLAQGQLLSDDCLYLFDDLASELDANHQSKLFELLTSHKGQYVITSIAPIGIQNMLPNENCAFYDVNDGIVINSMSSASSSNYA
jgi:DNA replication and repair protein RecF